MTLLHSSSGRPYCTTDAKVQVVLPQLTEIRLVALTKQLSRNRKMMNTNQGSLQIDLKSYENYVDREAKLAVDRHIYYSTPFRKSLTHIRGIQLCLQRRKSDLEESKRGNFGVYEGLQVKSLKNEIDKMMKENNYEAVKRRQTKKILAESKADGRIMNVKLSVPMLDAILKRPSLPLRRERQLGFESPPDTVSTACDRRQESKLHLPPVTVTRQNSPSKLLKKRAQAEKLGMERASTVI